MMKNSENSARDFATFISVGNDITLNIDLFKRVKSSYESKKSLDVTVEEQNAIG